MKIIRTLIFLVIISASITISNNESIPINTFIDPSEIKDTLLAPVVDAEAREKLEKRFEEIVINKKWENSYLNQFAPILFSYRDPKLKSILRQIISDNQINIYFKMRAIHSLGEIGDKNEYEFFKTYINHPNPIIREYIANAIGKLDGIQNITDIDKLLIGEKNLYVRETYKTTLRNIKNSKRYFFSTPPNDTRTDFLKVVFFPSSFLPEDSIKKESDFLKKPIDVKISHKCFSPHQQYKTNQNLYSIIEYPLTSFGLKDSWGLHVGEDSGWLFSGLPVHAILDGVVVRLQRETSWGCLIAIESILCDSSKITHYYGHLSFRITHKPGDLVHCGEKIGEIAESFSIDNGGYLAHLHLGIEKGPFEDAIIKGWSYSTDKWYSPIEFLKNYNELCKN